MRNKLLFIAVLLVSVNMFSWSSFRKNVPQRLVQPSGETIHVFASGDEFHNWLHNEKGQTIVQDPESGYYVYAKLVGDELLPTSFIVKDKELAPVSVETGLNISAAAYQRKVQTRLSRQIPVRKKDGGSSLKSTSTKKQGKCTNLVVLIGFSDVVKMDYSYVQLDSIYNHPTAWSVRTNYLADSYGKMTVESPVFPKSGSVYIDAHPRSYYSPYNVVTNPEGYKDGEESFKRENELVSAALMKAAKEIPSNMDMDQDGDGYIDNVTILFVCEPDGWSSLLWGHATFYSGNPEVLVNGKKVGRYNFLPMDYSLGSTTAHEIGHSFGYPDLYHYTQDGFEPVGKWDMQSNNKGHHGAYMKYMYGNWISDLPVLSDPGVYTLNPLNSPTEEKVGYKIPSPNSSTEFFVVEYRKPDPLIENHFEDDGLLLYRINPASTGNSDGGWGDFKDEVYIFRPGGSLVGNGKIDQAQQPASGISDVSRNRLFLSDGKDGGISISDIKKENGQLTFKLNFASAPFLRVTQESEIISAAGGQKIWPVMSNVAGWKATSSEKWATVSGDAKSGEIRLEVESNTGDPRLATIRVEAEGVPAQNYYLAQKSFDPEVDLLFLVDEEPILPIGNYAGAKRVLHVIGENYSMRILDASGNVHSQIFTAVEVGKTSFLYISEPVEPASKVEGKLVLATFGKKPLTIERAVEVVSQDLSFSRNMVQFLATDIRTQTVGIESSRDYQLEGTIPEWLTVQKSDDQRSLSLKVADNTSTGPRMAQFSIRAGLMSKPIVVNQRSFIPDFYFLKCPQVVNGEGMSTIWEYKTNADNIKFEYDRENAGLSFVHNAVNRTLTFTPNRLGDVSVDLKISLDDYSFLKSIESKDKSDLYQESSINSLPPEKNNSTFMTVGDRFLTDYPDLQVEGLKIEPVDEPDANVYCLTATETNYSLFHRVFAAPIDITQDPTIFINELTSWIAPAGPYSSLPIDFTFQNFYMIDKITCDQSWVEWDMKENGFSIRKTGYDGALSRNAIITLHSGAYTYPVHYTVEGSSTDPYLYLPLSEVTAPLSFSVIQVPVSTSKYEDLKCTLSGETQGISVAVGPDQYEEGWRYMGTVWIMQDKQISKNEEQTFTLHMEIGNQKKDFTVHTKKDMSGQYDPLPNENIQTNAQSPVRIYLVDGIVRIDSPYPVMDITVYGTSGQTLVRQQNGGDRIDISALSAGIYFVKVRTEQGTTVQKIITRL